MMAGGRAPYALRRERGYVVLTLGASHYHADGAPALAEALRDAGRICAETAPGRAPWVVADFGAVVLLSSIALRELRAAHIALGKRGGGIVAAGGGELVERVLKFAPFIAHHDSLDQALAALDAGRGETKRGAG
ncbi:MAG: hypothetical protein ACK5MQ_02635 [Pikeienuella sp.]